MSRLFCGWVALVALLAVAVAAAGPEEKKQPVPEKAGQAQSAAKTEAGERSTRRGQRVWVYGRGVNPSEYWIGVECYPVPPAIKAQLRLEQDQGLVVVQVLADSPAAKAGLREHDVLLKAADKTLGDVQDLMEAVDSARQKKVKLELVRDGKPMSVEVQPAKRPAAPEAADEDLDVLRGWLERMMPGENLPPKFFVLRPGAILAPGVSALPPLPDDTTVVITRHGSEPAKIVVQKGSQHWEVSEPDLDKLPAEVRPYVERMVHPYEVRPYAPRLLPPRPVPGAEARKQAEKQLEKHMEDMQRQIEKLQKSMEELRGNRK